MHLTIVKPKKQKTPVAVGAGEGAPPEDPEQPEVDGADEPQAPAES